MKKHTISSLCKFPIIILLSFNNYISFAQTGIGFGGVMGANLRNIIEDKDESYAGEELSSRYGLTFRYSPNQLFYFKSGLEWSSRIIKTDIKYQLDYLHIPLLFELDLTREQGEGYFYSTNIGFVFDFLLDESADGQQVDTGFRNATMNFHIGIVAGYVFFDTLKIGVAPHYNYTLTRVVVNDDFGKKRASYFGATVNITIDLLLDKK